MSFGNEEGPAVEEPAGGGDVAVCALGGVSNEAGSSTYATDNSVSTIVQQVTDAHSS